ncbi:FAD-dependent oxidoreductase [Qipengyuania atrilutea]|uniref:FAD-dependent oxidoreductase n=1 Tax=Qipengyuania atrilutea TaxID=2744473 RepID=A0A850HEZ6_9SPHN|nr:FAD-dependent oxidoreductase [Actirhodobacter atriluteus]NVD45859.1 FAD-dependent oxidoreductase [Actirhodobacter atriluteus]
MKKLLLLAVIAVAIGAFFWLGGTEYLSLEFIKAQRDSFDARYAENPALVIAAFFLVYVAATALSLPGAAILTLAAGYLFGLVVGVVVVSFASTIGATLAFLSARFILRDWVQEKFGQRLRAVNEGVKRDGALYLFSLRLVPVFPFFIVNMLMGLTPIKVWTYFWASQLGMLLGTIVYVNAGTQLSQVDTVGQIFTPALIASFAALAALPWIGKAVMGFVRRRKVYRGFTKPKTFDRNLIVIGAGSAGLVSAYIAALVKAKVTLVEANAMGGDCLNTGCVPSKALIKSAKVADAMRHADRYGITAHEPHVPFGRTMERVRNVIKAIEPHDSVERFEGLGVDVVNGYATLRDPWTVEIARNDGETQRLTARSIILATGAAPVVPSLPGMESSGYLTSETLWDGLAKFDAPPRRVVIMGGGPIGCELSQALARLGSGVTLVEMADRLLAREDDEVSELARSKLADAGVEVLTEHEAVRVENAAEGKALVVAGVNEERALPYDVLIVAVGRKARLSGFGLEDLRIDTEGTTATDAFLATKFPNIYAAGDVAGPFQLTHAASHQAWYASVNALFGTFKRFKADYRVIPATTFLDPEIARVGLNEKDAREQDTAYEVTRYDLDDLDRAIAESETRGFVKVLTVPGKDTILGATIVGANAGEMLAEFVLAMKHGLGLNKILSTIHTYPTMAEANKYAAGEWKQKNKPEWLLEWVAKYHAWRRG